MGKPGGEPIHWLPDGTPFSPRFNDRYRSELGGLSQSTEVFFHGCGLPAAWAGQPQWRILETGFGLGLNFLVTWAAWKADPQRPRLLHFVSIEAWPASADDLLRSASDHPELLPLAQQLHAQWWDLSPTTPGIHRLVFEGGQVQLTLGIGDAQAMLRELAVQADSVYLDGFSPQRNPDIWSAHTMKAVARHCRRGTRIATWTIARTVRDALAAAGFQVHKTPGVPPKRDNLQGQYDPAWEPRGQDTAASVRPSHCIVIGAGLAGAAAAHSLAQRGWQVRVLDAASTPAAGASALPAGLLAPLVSKDDNLPSRLSRQGIRATWLQAQALLQSGVDWQPSGVQEHRPGADPLWHKHAGWIRPARLVRAWLDHPAIQFQGQTTVHHLQPSANGGWTLLNAHLQTIAEAPLVVIAAALGSATISPMPLPLQAIRGQVSMGPCGVEPVPDFPVNGHGSFIPSVPTATGRQWLMGASFGRDSTNLAESAEEHQQNLEKLQTLLPATAQALQPAFSANEVTAWTGIRCAAPDRLPLVGELQPGLWTSTAMGSRGLTYARLCAELLAAQLHAEPWPTSKKQAAALDVQRVLKPSR